jgi:hypothetical protein
MKRTPLTRTTRLKAKGGSRYPHRRHPKFMRWMLERLREGQPCDCGCAHWATDRAHLIAKGSGGDDHGNVVLLWRECHGLQEKRTSVFCALRGVNLWAIAKQWAERYDRETSG